MSPAAPRNGKKRIDSKQRRLEIRDRLLAAIDALAIDGDSYSTVSVEKLANAAGISRATFYIYFEGKADLLSAWFAETLEELAVPAERWWALGAEAGAEDLAAVLGDFMDVYLGHRGLMAAINDEATQNDELRDILAVAIQRGIDGLRDHIERGQAEGFIDPGLLAVETAAWLVWLIERGLNNVLDATDAGQSDLLRSNLTSMIWHVLYAGSQAHPATVISA